MTSSRTSPRLPHRTSTARTPPASRQEYIYICSSKQMPGVFKVGETHRQTPKQRANQLTGVDRRVKWDVERMFVSPDSRYSETLVHRRLTASGTRVEGYREIFSADLPTLVCVIEKCVERTPAPPNRVRPASIPGTVAVPRGPEPWHLVLSLPVQHVDEPDMTLARAMARAAAGDDRLRRRLHNWGVELVYPDTNKPSYRLHAMEGSVLGAWLQAQGLSWKDLAIPVGSSRKISCQVQSTRTSG
jgi:hypothetical protein